MNCRDAQAWIQPFLSHSLEPAQLAQYLKHIKSCPSCSDDLEIHFIIEAGLEQLDSAEPGQTDLKKLLQAEIDDAESYVHTRYLIQHTRQIAMIVTNVMLILAILRVFHLIPLPF